MYVYSIEMRDVHSNPFEYHPTFINLPYLVIKEILGYLDTISLKNLRLTCHQTKSWIDIPCYLEKCPIYLQRNFQMEEILQSRIKWRSVVIDIRVCLQDYNLTEFLKKFNGSIKTIRIKPHSFLGVIELNQLLNILLNVGPQLESLEFSLGFEIYNFAKRKRPFDRRLYEILKRNLIGLKKLILIEVEVESGLGQVQQFLTNILSVCDNLEVLQLPQWPEHETFTALEMNVFCKCLISYFENASTQPEGPSLKNIYFGDLNTHLNKVKVNIPSGNLLFRKEIPTLLQLILRCATYGVKLYNVLSMALPKYTNLSDYDKKCLDNCIQSVISIDQNIGIPHTTYIPSTCKVHVFVLLNKDQQDTNFELGDDLNISSIYLYFDSIEKSITDTPIVQIKLLQTIRPSVLELTLNGKSCYPQNGLKLSIYFPNLTKLWIIEHHNFTRESINFMLDGLEHLKELKLEHCKFNPQNFHGFHNDGIFLKLKDFIHVKIIRCYVELDGPEFDFDSKDFKI